MDKQLNKLQKERQVVVANEYIFKLDFSSKQNNLNSPSGQNIETCTALCHNFASWTTDLRPTATNW